MTEKQYPKLISGVNIQEDIRDNQALTPEIRDLAERLIIQMHNIEAAILTLLELAYMRGKDQDESTD